MRMVLAVLLAAGGLVVAAPAAADPETCPPACDRIPDSAWIASWAIPLNSRYGWPRLPGLAVTATAPRFRFEELCASPPVAQDPRSYVVAEKAAVANPDGQWQLQAQVLHWRGETWRGGQLAEDVFNTAVAALRSCQRTNPSASPSLTTLGTGPDGGRGQRAGDPAPVPGGRPGQQHGHRTGAVVDLPAADRRGRRRPTTRCSTRSARRCARPISGRARSAPVQLSRTSSPTSARSFCAPGGCQRDAQSRDSRPAGPGHRRRAGPARARRHLRCPAGQAIRTRGGRLGQRCRSSPRSPSRCSPTP